MKFKKPVKPKKPIKPTPPNKNQMSKRIFLDIDSALWKKEYRSYEEDEPISKEDFNYELHYVHKDNKHPSLADLIKLVPSNSAGEYLVPLTKIHLDIDTQYSESIQEGDGEILCGVSLYYDEPLDYKVEYKKYEEELKQYQLDLLQYGKDVLTYEKDLVQYQSLKKEKQVKELKKKNKIY